MSNALTLFSGSELTAQEQNELESSIESCIAAHQNNRQEINRLVFESVAAMTEGEAYETELANKKGLKRFFGGITGSNKKLQDKINSSRAVAQYAAQQTLQRLAEQNLLTFDLIAAVNNKLNASMIAVENELNQVYSVLLKFFSQSRSDIVRLENRLDKLERNVKLLNWQNSIEYQMFEGVEYAELPDVAKVVCLVRDFYDITNGEWSTSDLLLMKTAMATIGLAPKSLVGYGEFISVVANNEKLKDYLLAGQHMVKMPENYLVPLLGLKKQELLAGDEHFMVDSMADMLVENDLPVNQTVICNNLTRKYLRQETQVDVNTQLECFDLIMETLFNLCEAEELEIFDVEEDDDEAWLYNEKKLAEKFNEASQALLKNQFDGSLPILQEIADSFFDKKYSHMAFTLMFDKAYELFFEGQFAESQPILNFLSEMHFGDENNYRGKASALLYWITLDGYPGVAPNKDEAELFISMSDDDVITQKMMDNIQYTSMKDMEEVLNDVTRLQRQADSGEVLAIYLMGIYNLNEFSNTLDLLEGKEPYKKPDYKAAVTYFREAADKWDFYRAYYSMALRYYKGEGVAQDYDTAIDWAKKAMKFPQFNKATKLIADILYEKEDYEEAMRYYQIYEPDGADCINCRGCIELQKLIGGGNNFSAISGGFFSKIFLSASRMAKEIAIQSLDSDSPILNYYKRAADLGSARGQYNWAICLIENAKELDEAKKYAEKAASQRYQPAVDLMKSQFNTEYLFGDDTVWA